MKVIFCYTFLRSFYISGSLITMYSLQSFRAWKSHHLNCNLNKNILTHSINMDLISILFLNFISGSLPPSPADSGVSDVDSSSSGNGQPICSDEIKARLGLSATSATPNNSGQQQTTQLPPPTHGTFLHPNFYHQTAPLRNLWSNRNVSCE